MAKKLTKRQLAVIEDLFTGGLDEQTVLEKHRVSRNLFNKWLTDARFTEQFNERIARAYRQSQLIIARYAPLAAAKLVQLTEAENNETARKACLDIISHAAQKRASGIEGRESNTQPPDPLPQAIASKLLAALAENTIDY